MLLFHEKQRSNQVVILHLPQQLSCQDMQNIHQIWSLHYNRHNNSNYNNKQLWADQPCVKCTPGLSNWTDVGTLWDPWNSTLIYKGMVKRFRWNITMQIHIKHF